jgi:ribosomal-protein-serine acetyltransferase
MVSIQVSEDLILRTYTRDDASVLFGAIDQNRAHLRPWLKWVDATTKEDDSLAFIEQSLHEQEQQRGLALGIFQGERLIGGLGMMNWNRDLNKAEIGYWVSADQQGKGIISNCLKAFIDFLFERIQLHKVEIHFVATNKRSSAVAERMQAKIEGVLRDSYIANGAYKDLVITGILRADWKMHFR